MMQSYKDYDLSMNGAFNDTNSCDSYFTDIEPIMHPYEHDYPSKMDIWPDKFCDDQSFGDIYQHASIDLKITNIDFERSLEDTFSSNSDHEKVNIDRKDDSLENPFSIPCLTRIAQVDDPLNVSVIPSNDNDTQPPQLSFHKRKRKRRIDLTPDQESFKNRYYKYFTQKKKFSKDYVIKIHKYMAQHLSFPKISRDETRQIDLYFQHYAFAQNKIFDFIEKNHEELKKIFD